MPRLLTPEETEDEALAIADTVAVNDGLVLMCTNCTYPRSANSAGRRHNGSMAATVTEEQIIEALRPVEDPELHRSIVDLDMVESVSVDSSVVGVRVLLTIAGYWMMHFDLNVTPLELALNGIMQGLCIGMIFVPSIGGISHSPREYSDPQAIVAGVNVLLHTLLMLDGG